MKEVEVDLSSCYYDIRIDVYEFLDVIEAVFDEVDSCRVWWGEGRGLLNYIVRCLCESKWNEEQNEE